MARTTKRLKWLEPRSVRRAIEAAHPKKRLPWLRPVLVVILVTAFMMLDWFRAKQDPEKNPLPFFFAVALCLGFALFIVYPLDWLVRLVPAEVSLRRLGITRVHTRMYGQQHRCWKYADIAECRIEPVETKHRHHRLLVITTIKGETDYIGVPESVPIDKLEHALAEEGVTIIRSQNDTPRALTELGPTAHLGCRGERQK